jgi:molybdopterin converting factor small subunit
MDITLTHIFSAVVLLGIFAITLIFLLKSKVAQLEANLKQQSESSSNSLAKTVKAIEEKLIHKVEELNQQTVKNNVLQTNLVEELSKSTIQQNDSLQGIIKATGDKIEKVTHVLAKESNGYLQEASEAIKSLITSKVEALKKDQTTVAFKNKQDNLSNIEQLTSLINSVRVSNLVELTNELAKHQELTIETDEFLKQLGDCKVLKLEDKHSGQVTQIYYDDGIKRSSDTFAGDVLKYQMFYNASGKAEKGLELDTKGNVIFEYIYDDAGEISKKIESLYDESGSKTGQEEKSY